MTIKQINKLVWFIPIRKLRDKVRNELFIKYSGLFQGQFNNNKMKEILKENINSIEIETHSYCNRQCWFCPNSIVDRHSENKELDEKLFLKIINELSEIKYSNNIHFHRFNEPLSAKELILKRIRQTKEILPNAKIGIFTNGDYLTTEYLDDLSEVGISYMIMSYYLKYNEEFNIEQLKFNMQKNIDKFNFKVENFNIVDDYYIYYNLIYKNISINYRAMDFSKIGSDRGGIIKGVKSIDNEFSCSMPLNNIYIDYNGMVMPCCDLRSDIKEHEHMILGDISKNTIFEIFTSEKSSKMRKYLYAKSTKIPPCSTCSWYQ